MSAPIFGFNAARSSIVEEVVHRVTTQTRDPLHALNEAAYMETKRLQSSGHPDLAEWRTLAAHLGRMTDSELRDRLKHYAERYAWDVAGNFDGRVYKFASKAMAPLLGALMSPRATLKNLPASLDLTGLCLLYTSRCRARTGRGRLHLALCRRKIRGRARDRGRAALPVHGLLR